jgi:hypothetical protein
VLLRRSGVFRRGKCLVPKELAQKENARGERAFSV